MSIFNLRKKYPPIIFYNTLTGKKENFISLSREVTIYSCGPTVYDYVHIGNLRAYIFADTLNRMMRDAGYRVRHIINITDVGHLTDDADSGEDKIELQARKKKKTAREIVDECTQAFFSDLKSLSIPEESYSFPRATEYIQEQIEMVKALEKENYTYRIEGDGIYFDTSAFSEYGVLAGRSVSDGYERIGVNRYKRSPNDFALWKLIPSGVSYQQEWDSPWGRGTPGWHIECSAMARSLLGESIDIHTGGIDHIPIHHTNEIAQIEALTKKPFVNYWLHTAFLKIDGNRIGKSEGNAILLSDLMERGFPPLALRYLFLTSHHRKEMNFTEESLHAATSAYNRLVTLCEEAPTGGNVLLKIVEEVQSALRDNLDTPTALSVIWKMVRSDRTSKKDIRATLYALSGVLGLSFKPTNHPSPIPHEIQSIVTEREDMRKQKNYKKADVLRKKVLDEGFVIKDTEHGPSVSKKIS